MTLATRPVNDDLQGRLMLFSTRRTGSWISVGAALVLGLAACGDGEDTSAASSETMADDMSPSEHMADDMSPGEHMSDEMSDGHHDTFAFGEPADPAEADRTVQIEAKDIEFDPMSVEVVVGETITFVVTNTGAAAHDFTLGDAHIQDEHEAEMQQMAGDMMHDDVNAFVLAPGETKELTWRFTAAGEVLYGCHQPGHYAAGMVGSITVVE